MLYRNSPSFRNWNFSTRQILTETKAALLHGSSPLSGLAGRESDACLEEKQGSLRISENLATNSFSSSAIVSLSFTI